MRPRRVERGVFEPDPFDPRAYGAAYDGVTDDSEAIRAAIEAQRRHERLGKKDK